LLHGAADLATAHPQLVQGFWIVVCEYIQLQIHQLASPLLQQRCSKGTATPAIQEGRLIRNAHWAEERKAHFEHNPEVKELSGGYELKAMH
jgi:hypothetical protein